MNLLLCKLLAPPPEPHAVLLRQVTFHVVPNESLKAEQPPFRPFAAVKQVQVVDLHAAACSDVEVALELARVA